MDRSTSTFVLTLCLVVVVPSVLADIDCHFCTAVVGQGSDCEDKFHASDFNCTGTYCMKVISEAFGLGSVTRACSNDPSGLTCNSVSLFAVSVKTCTCDTPFCNSALPTITVNMLLLVSTVFTSLCAVMY